jgi:hypothetical protein
MSPQLIMSELKHRINVREYPPIVRRRATFRALAFLRFHTMFWVYFQVVLAFCIFVGIVWWTLPKSIKKSTPTDSKTDQGQLPEVSAQADIKDPVDRN